MIGLKKENIFCVFMLVFLTSSFTICNDIWSSAITIALWLAVLCILLLHSHKVGKKNFLITVFFIACMGLSTILNGENIRTYVVVSFSFIVILIFTSQICLNQFIYTYIYVIKILCIISLVGYVAFLAIPSLHNYFVTTNNVGAHYSNLILYVDTIKNNRNYGMFWEPGAFATFINLALLFEVMKEQFNVKNILIFSVTLITTYSTTGYIGFIFIMILIYTKKNLDKNYKILLVLCTMAVILAIYFNPKLNALLFGSSLSNGQSTVFGKIFSFYNKTNNTVMTSADVRYNSIFEVLKAFFEKPLIGYGYKGLSERVYSFTGGMNTCTVINWFATYGVIYGCIATWGMILFAKKLGSTSLAKIVIFIAIFIITMSENYVQNAFFVILILYGFSVADKREDIVVEDIINENCGN